MRIEDLYPSQMMLASQGMVHARLDIARGGSKRIMLMGGDKSGKTTCGLAATFAWYLCNTIRSRPGAIIAPSTRVLRDAILPRIEETIRRIEIMSARRPVATLDVLQNRLEFHPYQIGLEHSVGEFDFRVVPIVYLISGSNIDSLKGWLAAMRPDWIWYDNADEFEDIGIGTDRPAEILKACDPERLLVTSVPSNFQEDPDDEPRTMTELFMRRLCDADPRYTIVRARTEDNMFLPDGYAKDLLSLLPREQISRRYLGIPLCRPGGGRDN